MIKGGIGDFLQCLPHVMAHPEHQYLVASHHDHVHEHAGEKPSRGTCTIFVSLAQFCATSARVPRGETSSGPRQRVKIFIWLWNAGHGANMNATQRGTIADSSGYDILKNICPPHPPHSIHACKA